jgi:cytoskeleton protein RodZ
MSNKKKIEELSEDIEVIGPGQMLSEARESIGLTQQQVADKLNFRTTLVKDIEADNFDRSLPATFNRGYLKNYAKLVNLDVDEVLAGYDILNVAEKQGAEMQSFSKQTEKQAENNLVMWVSYLIVALLIGSTILWWLQDTDQTNAVKPIIKTSSPTVSANLQEDLDINKTVQEQNNPHSAEAPITTLSETLKENLVVSGDDLITNTNNSETTQDAPEAVEQISSGIELLPNSSANNDINNEINSSADSTVSNEEGTSEVDLGAEESAQFVFSGDCWVNIYDATGERIAWGIKKSGYTMNISGQAPFTITLGKPELVSIDFEGETVDMSQFSRGNIAKFNLPLN